MKENTSTHGCVCGKEAANHCSGCKVQKYCSRICQKKDWNNHKKACLKPVLTESKSPSRRTDIFQHIKDHINKNWANRISEYLEQWKEYTGDLGFALFFVVTKPIGDYFYENAMPKPKHFTFAFFLLKDFPRTIFMAVSDHIDGAYKRVCPKEFICSHESILYSKDEFPKDVVGKCVIPDRTPKYDYVNWSNGEMYDNGDLEKFYPFKTGPVKVEKTLRAVTR